MKTKNYFIVLAIAIHAIALGQMQTNNKQILMSRISKSGTFHYAEKPAPENKLLDLNQRIRSYDQQIAELQKAKEELNSDLHVFFESKSTNNLYSQALLLEKQADISFGQYQQNYDKINILLAAKGTQITSALINEVAKAGAQSRSARLMKEEALAQSDPDARAGALGNCLEKIQAALNTQAAILNTTYQGAPAQTAVCYGK